MIGSHNFVTQENVIQPPPEVLQLKMADDQDVEDEEIAFEERYPKPSSLTILP